MTLVQERKATLVAKRVLNTLIEINNQLNDFRSLLESSTNFSNINKYHKKIMCLLEREGFYAKIANGLITTYKMDWNFYYKDEYHLDKSLTKELDFFDSFVKMYF